MTPAQGLSAGCAAARPAAASRRLARRNCLRCMKSGVLYRKKKARRKAGLFVERKDLLRVFLLGRAGLLVHRAGLGTGLGRLGLLLALGLLLLGLLVRFLGLGRRRGLGRLRGLGIRASREGGSDQRNEQLVHL